VTAVPIASQKNNKTIKKKKADCGSKRAVFPIMILLFLSNWLYLNVIITYIASKYVFHSRER
jgi:hypothetical protein